MFPGNSDSDASVNNDLQQPIVTRYVRLLPLTWNENIRMSVDVMGCAFEATGTCECDDEWQVDGTTGACTTRSCANDFECFNGGSCDVNVFDEETSCLCLPGFHGRDCSSETPFNYFS